MVDHDPALRDEIAAYAVGALTAEEAAACERHLATCARCRETLRGDREALVGMAAALSPEVPPSSLYAGIQARLRAAAPRPTRIGSERSRAAMRAQRTAPRWPRLLAWAAVAAAFVALSGFALQTQRRLNDRTAELARLAGVPPERVATMVSTTAAPTASARLYITGEDRAVLTVSGLPPPPPGRVYQFWFFASSDRPRESGAIFRTGANGAAVVDVRIPGALDQYREIWVTQEPEGGNPQPTAPHFLEGPITL